jgi:hypothetical protein
MALIGVIARAEVVEHKTWPAGVIKGERTARHVTRIGNVADLGGGDIGFVPVLGIQTVSIAFGILIGLQQPPGIAAGERSGQQARPAGRREL